MLEADLKMMLRDSNFVYHKGTLSSKTIEGYSKAMSIGKFKSLQEAVEYVKSETKSENV